MGVMPGAVTSAVVSTVRLRAPEPTAALIARAVEREGWAPVADGPVDAEIVATDDGFRIAAAGATTTVTGWDGLSAWARTTTPRAPQRASDAQVSAALAAAAAVGPFFAVTAAPGDPGSGWTGLAGSLAPFVDDVAARLGTAERRVAASIMFQALAARLVSPVVAGLEQGIVLDLDPASTSVRSRPGEALGVLCTHPGGWVSTSAQLVASVVIERQLRPIVVALSADAAEGLLWGNVASALVGALKVMGAGPGSVAFSVVRELLEIGPLAGALDERFRRRSCCLFYRAVPGAYCGDCALGR